MYIYVQKTYMCEEYQKEAWNIITEKTLYAKWEGKRAKCAYCEGRSKKKQQHPASTSKSIGITLHQALKWAYKM